MNHKKLLSALIFGLAPLTAWAHASCLEGHYSTLQHSAELLKVTAHHHDLHMMVAGVKQPISLKALTDSERDNLWSQQQWAPESAKDVECAADADKKYVLCELSYLHKKAEPSFSNADSILVQNEQKITLLSHD